MMSDYFTKEELRCKCGCDQELIDKEFLELLDDLRGIVGKPFIITSGYRCSEYNKDVSSTGSNGPHTLGRAVDIKADSKLKFEIVEKAIRHFDCFRFGIAKNFIHIDDLSEEDGFSSNVIWTY